ncbi:hypothetical protein K439DRAFT_661221 [Ramaria rubella]|nr:hypothetical protein K439DRAFT_661221 [Ramaria rubella]
MYASTARVPSLLHSQLPQASGSLGVYTHRSDAVFFNRVPGSSRLAWQKFRAQIWAVVSCNHALSTRLHLFKIHAVRRQEISIQDGGFIPISHGYFIRVVIKGAGGGSPPQDRDNTNHANQTVISSHTITPKLTINTARITILPETHTKPD